MREVGAVGRRTARLGYHHAHCVRAVRYRIEIHIVRHTGRATFFIDRRRALYQRYINRLVNIVNGHRLGIKGGPVYRHRTVGNRRPVRRHRKRLTRVHNRVVGRRQGKVKRAQHVGVIKREGVRPRVVTHPRRRRRRRRYRRV